MADMDNRGYTQGAAADVNIPAANTAAVITYAAVSGKRHAISGIAYSYSAAPTGGNLKIEDVAGTTIFSLDITAAGPGDPIYFDPAKGNALPNTALIITLAAGGVGISGKVNVLGHWLTGS